MALQALGFVDLAKAQEALVDRRRNLDLRAAVDRAGERLRATSVPQGVWEIVRDAAPVFGAVGVGLTLGRLAGRSDEGTWSHGLDDLPPDALRARYGLIAERPGDNHLDLAWTDGRDAVHRDVEIAVELLCEHVSEALDRIERDLDQAPAASVITLRPSPPSVPPTDPRTPAPETGAHPTSWAVRCHFNLMRRACSR